MPPGFGKALAEAVIARGHAVVGTTRDGAAPPTNSSGRPTTLALDVAYAAVVPVVVEQTVRVTGRLDVVVNNAGCQLLGSMGEATEQEIDHLFEVSFPGLAESSRPCCRICVGRARTISSTLSWSPGWLPALVQASTPPPE